MSLSDTRSKIVYLPDGSQTRFDIVFPLFRAGDLECVAVDRLGVETAIAAFEVVNMESESGPAVVFDSPPPAGCRLVLRRKTRPVHETEYPEGGRFPSRTVEADFDAGVAMIQELWEAMERTIKADSSADKAPSAGEFFGRMAEFAESAEEAGNRAAEEAAAAAGAARNAVEAEAMARGWAEIPEDEPVVEGHYSAFHWAMKALQNASDGIRLSDALDGERKAADGVAASEWALGLVNAKAGQAETSAREAVREAGAAVLEAGAAAEAAQEARTEAAHAADSASPYRLCEFYSFRHPVLRPGFMPRYGGLIQNAAELYPQAWAYLQTAEGLLLCKTEAEWQALSVDVFRNPDGSAVARAAGWEGIGGVPFYAPDYATGALRLPDTRGMHEEDAGFHSLGVGGVHGDAIRNIAGALRLSGGYMASVSGAFAGSKASGNSGYGYSGGASYQYIYFNSSNSVPTAAKNQPRAWGALPCVWLGRPAA